MDSPLQDGAMLVTLSISAWSARKLDRRATHEVDQAHGASGAGRYNKLLIDKSALEPIEQVEGAARQHHYLVTLPWGNRGERILTTALFMDYISSMDTFKAEFNKRVEELVTAYPAHVQAARRRLGTLYDPQDYPLTIREKFSFNIEFNPVAGANDFRVKLSEDHVARMRQEIEQRQRVLQEEAMQHLWGRVRETVQRVYETCSKEKPRIFDSLTGDVATLADLLPALNLTNDSKLTAVATGLKQLAVPAEVLRRQASKRSELAAHAASMLQVLP